MTCSECGAAARVVRSPDSTLDGKTVQPHYLACPAYLAAVHRNNPHVKRRSTMRKILAALGLAAILAVTAPPAQADSQPPYGGCGEAIDYPRSDGADWCRDHGFTVTRSIVVTPYGYVVSYRMPKCSVEDASNGPVPCRWNFGKGQTGNGVGKAFWVSRNGKTHYVKGMATAN